MISVKEVGSIIDLFSLSDKTQHISNPYGGKNVTSEPGWAIFMEL